MYIYLCNFSGGSYSDPVCLWPVQIFQLRNMVFCWLSYRITIRWRWWRGLRETNINTRQLLTGCATLVPNVHVQDEYNREMADLAALEETVYTTILPVVVNQYDELMNLSQESMKPALSPLDCSLSLNQKPGMEQTFSISSNCTL